jgi:TATA-box binding protein (TBP) (component of TFIID and TFIIIB)
MDKDEILQRIELKKKFLSEQKLLYSQTTDELSAENQIHFRMFKALKKQNSNIKNQTKIYIDNCVQRAYYEAELKYSHQILDQVSDQTEYV